MKTLLVLAPHPDVVDAIRAGLDTERYRLIHRANFNEIDPLLAHGLVDACILDLELMSVQAVWSVEKLRRRAPHCPVIVYVGAKNWEWEEEAYLQGAAHVLAKPVRPKMLAAVLERLWPLAPVRELSPVQISAPDTSFFGPVNGTPPQSLQTLGILRSFSGILTHSLDASAMLSEFLRLLRDILCVNRAVIFLRPALPSAAEAARGLEEQTRLRAFSSIGVSTSLLQHFELSFQAGIGGHVHRLGRILRRQSEEARADLETQKEFELLGSQVAVPILDRDAVIGVAVFDGHITGEPLINSELELIFRLLEQLGLAMKNIWLHDQLAANHEMMAGIMRELSSGCIVVGRNLGILHANKMARKFFTKTDRRTGELDFSDLPPAIGAKIYQVLNTGSALSSFRYQPEDAPGTLYSLSIVPFQRQPGGLPSSVLLVADDLTQAEHYKRLEIEAANYRQLREMADRLTAELGNAITRPTAYLQLLGEKLVQKAVDVESLKRMERDLGEDFTRVRRLVSLLRYLNADPVLTAEPFQFNALLEESFQEARKHQATKSPNLVMESTGTNVQLRGDRTGLKLAFAEVMLNAIQANMTEPKIGVRLTNETNGNNTPSVVIEVQDNGPGFSPETLQKATAPFFTTKVVGLGLGLTITQRIIEGHRGKLELLPPSGGRGGLVRISLPATPG